MRRYNCDDKALPLESLLREIKKRSDILYHIAPSKMEELVGRVFSEFFVTKAIHCGRSHDGGVDLLLVEGDEPH